MRVLIPALAVLALLLEDPARAGTRGDDHVAVAPEQDAERAIELVRAGEYEQARELLGQILVRRDLALGAEQMHGGDPRDALVHFDHALELEPKNASALFLRGRASFDAATLFPTNALYFYEDAEANFEDAWKGGYGVEAPFEASRAARMAGKSEKALELALAGMAELEKQAEPPELAQPAERTLVEAAFDRYVAQRQAGETADELYRLSEDHLKKLLGREPTDAWAWTQLTNLHQWGGDLASAFDAAKLGLEILPEDAGLHARAAELARASGGRELVLSFYSDFVTHRPEIALGWWYSGVELVLRGCDRLAQAAEAAADFKEAQARFQRCRQLQPSYEKDCRGYEVVCRSGLGWSARAQGDLAGAEVAFHSMEDVVEKGLSWAYPPYLGSGVEGLQALADDYYVGHEEDAGAVANAVAIYDFLQTYQPDDGTVANNAGFFNRDLAVLLDQQAERGLTRARDVQNPAERDAARSEAQSLRERARERMDRSWEAYQRAAALSPEDARIQNDTGLIMAYYLRSDAKVAEDYFLRAIALSEKQLADEALLASMPEHVRTDLPRAYGDACQNMGVLYLTMRRDPARAREWFEKSITIGPPDREDVTKEWILACEKMIAGDPEALAGVRREIWSHQDR
jgi:tetratricopeptide (TPR) repeat protein